MLNESLLHLFLIFNSFVWVSDIKGYHYHDTDLQNFSATYQVSLCSHSLPFWDLKEFGKKKKSSFQVLQALSIVIDLPYNFRFNTITFLRHFIHIISSSFKISSYCYSFFPV